MPKKSPFMGVSIAIREDSREYEAKLVKFFASKHRLDQTPIQDIFNHYKKRKGRGKGSREVLINTARDARRLERRVKKFAKDNPDQVAKRSVKGHIWNWMTIGRPTPPM